MVLFYFVNTLILVIFAERLGAEKSAHVALCILSILN